jgi:serine/threonine protein kinase
VKIADFGISKRAEGGEGTASLQTVTGTFGFIAPEVLVQNNIIQNPGFEFREEYKTAVDMWSLGVIVYQALTGKKPFPTAQGEYIGALREYVKGGSFMSLPMDISSDGFGFLRALLRPTPKDRLAARDALSHSWIAPPKTPENELDDIERYLRHLLKFLNYPAKGSDVLQTRAHDRRHDHFKISDPGSVRDLELGRAL